MEAGRMVVVDGVQSSWRMTKSRRCSGSVIRYRLSDRSLRPLQEPHLERVARIVTERYCRPVRTASSATRDGSTATASRRNCSHRRSLLRAKGWGVEVVGRAARLFDPGPSESIRCGFPEIPRPGRSRRRKVGEPDGAVRPYAERNAPCPSALREGHLSDYRMDDRLLPADGFSGLGLRFGLSGCRMIRLGAKQAE